MEIKVNGEEVEGKGKRIGIALIVLLAVFIILLLVFSPFIALVILLT